MSNKYHLQQNEPQQQHSSMAFLPMLCSSSSTKQVKRSHRRSASSSSSSSTIGDDPSSPKVGCMGQVKRGNRVVGFPNISFTTTTTSTSNSSNISSHHVIKCHEQNNYTSNSIIKYHKLKKFFSSRNLTSSPTSVIPAARTAVSGSQKGNHRRTHSANIVVNNSRGRAIVTSDHHLGKKTRSKVNENSNCCGKNSNEMGTSEVNLIELDPPLPVVKKQLQQQGNDGENIGSSTLWKRRSGGVPLKSLQVQINHSLVPANTV